MSCQIEQLLPLLHCIQHKISIRGKNTCSYYSNNECHISNLSVTIDSLAPWSVSLAQQLNRCTFILRVVVVILLNIAWSFHVDRELVEFVPVDEQEYDEVIEEYEEKILVQEGAPEPVSADLTGSSPAQGKPRCITPILKDH